jgi:hypothetical protein
MREIECARWFIGRCVVLCVQVVWFVGGGKECKFCGGGFVGRCVVLCVQLCGSLAGEMSTSASALGDRRACVEVV